MSESTGVFITDEKASMHIQAGAKKVILTAPGKGDRVGTFVVGGNDDQYRHEDWDILSNASCTISRRINIAVRRRVGRRINIAIGRPGASPMSLALVPSVR